MILLTRGPRKPVSSFVQEARERIAADDASSLVLIVPTRRKVRALQRELTASFPDRAIQLPAIVTLQELAQRLYPVIRSGKQMLDPVEERVLFYSAIDRVRWEYFAHAGSTPTIGVIDRLFDVLTGLKEDGITSNRLREELDASDMNADVREPRMMRDIAHLASAYESLLSERGVSDSIDLYGHLTRHAEQHSGALIRSAFSDCSLVLLEGFSELRLPEREFLFAIVRDASLSVQLLIDYEEGNENLFGNLKEMIEFFAARGFLSVPLQQTDAENTRSTMRRSLFNGNAGQKTKAAITVHEAVDRRDEARTIARAIKERLTADPTIPLSSVCVAMYRPAEYTTIIREEFAAYGIPCNITDRSSLAAVPAIQAIMSLLQTVDGDYSRDDVLRVARSPFFTFRSSLPTEGDDEQFVFGDDPNAKPESQFDWENLRAVAIELKITGNKNRWLERITDGMRRLDLYDDTELGWRRREERIRSLTKAATDVRGIFHSLESLEGAMTGGELHARLSRLLETLRFEKNFITDVTRLLRAGERLGQLHDAGEIATRAYSAFRTVLESVLNLLDTHILCGRREPIGYFLDYVRPIIESQRVNVQERVDRGVLVTACEETRGLQFELMFLCGLIDGSFPTVYKPERFLGKTLRKSEAYHQRNERYLFMQAAGNFSKHLVCTYPRGSAREENVRSCFLDALLEVFECDMTASRLPGSASADATIYSARELYDRIGTRLSQGFAIDARDANHLPVGFPARVTRSVAIERSRIDQDRFAEYRGVLPQGVTNPSGKKATYSVSQFETYGACPFRYFTTHVLRLHELTEGEEGLEPLDRGKVLHEILFDFFTERKKKKAAPLAGMNESSLAIEERRVAKIAARAIERIVERHPFWEVDAREYFGVVDERTLGRGVLRSFLRTEASTAVTLAPAFFEVRFGSPGRVVGKSDESLSVSETVEFEGFSLAGKIDRIDLNGGAFGIVDYKTGASSGGIREIEAGAAFQMPLYLAAAEKLLERFDESQRAALGAIYYEVHSPMHVKRALGLVRAEGEGALFIAPRTRKNKVDAEAFRAAIDLAAANATAIVREIETGNFILRPNAQLDRVCTYCDYKRACRIQLVRAIGADILPVEEDA